LDARAAGDSLLEGPPAAAGRLRTRLDALRAVTRQRGAWRRQQFHWLALQGAGEIFEALDRYAGPAMFIGLDRGGGDANRLGDSALADFEKSSPKFRICHGVCPQNNLPTVADSSRQ